MGFRLPKGARSFFAAMDVRKDEGSGLSSDAEEPRIEHLFDMFYFCLMLGLQTRELGRSEDVESKDFYSEYPIAYSSYAGLIAALLIESEMVRRGIRLTDAQALENLMLEVLDHRTPTILKDAGVDLANRYAARGMQLIYENISKTSRLEVFLIHYCRLLWSVDQRSSESESATSAMQ
jgi:hypothetical protein